MQKLNPLGHYETSRSTGHQRRTPMLQRLFKLRRQSSRLDDWSTSADGDGLLTINPKRRVHP